MPKEEFAMLAHHYNPNLNYNGWMASRKYNGWGCIWDGGLTRGMLAEDVPWYYKGGDKDGVISTGLWTIGRSDKNGIRPKVIYAPDVWLSYLPKGVPLQGELWYEDNLSFVKMVCGRKDSGLTDPRWPSISFVVYNVKPYSKWKGITDLGLGGLKDNHFYLSTVWQSRMEKASKEISLSNPVITWAEQTKVESEAHLNELVRTAKVSGWEGIMLINPISYYECFRSYNLVKIKPTFETEAEVIGYEDGKTGKNIGKLGSVMCQLTWDSKVLSVTGGKGSFIDKTVTFGISGWDDDEREWDWIKEAYPVGSLVPFSYLGVSMHGVPSSCNRIKQGGQC